MYDIIITSNFNLSHLRALRGVKAMEKKESLMVNVRKQRFLIVLAVITAFVFTTFGAVTGAKAATVNDDIALAYADNRNVVKILDEVEGGEPVYFKKLKETTALSPEETLQALNRVASIAKSYASFEKTASSVNAGAEAVIDSAISDEVAELKTEAQTFFTGSLKLSESNYLSYDADGALTDGLASLGAKYKLYSYKVALAKELTSLMSVNSADPTATATSRYGVYDTDMSVNDYGMAGLLIVYNEGKQQLETSANRQETVDEYVVKLRAVPRNKFELIYNDYLEATAVERGALSEEDADLENNLVVKAMGQSEKDVEDFYALACEDIKNAYKTQYGYLQNYFTSHQEYDGTAVSKNTSSLDFIVNGKTIMTVTAYIKNVYPETKTKATVFAPNASIALYSAMLTGEAKNASDLLRSKNAKLGIGYLVRFNVYGGIVNSQEFDVKKANDSTEGGVVYEIKFNLNNFYSEIVAKDQGLIGKALENVDFLKGVWGSADKSEKITKASELVKDTETDLCYLYKNGEFTPFDKINYNPDGGILMLETTSFGNFAIAAVETTPAFLQSPLFWILAIVALIVLIVIIKLIVKYHKYSVKFYPNGGNKVKKARARKGEYIAMPANPVRTGYVFAGWFEDKALTRRFVSTRMVKRENLKVYAKWNLELSKERIDRYYETLRNELASHGALYEGCAIEEGKEKTFAIIEKGDKNITLYTAFDTKTLLADGYPVSASGAGYEETPSVFVITKREDFIVAQKIVSKLIKTYDLKETEYEEANKDEVKFVLKLVAPVVVAAEEQKEEKEEIEETPVVPVLTVETEEETENKPEETEETEVVIETETEEEPVEADEETSEEAEKEPATEEQLIEYFTKIRNAVCGYALYEPNDAAENGKMLIKLYKKDEAVYCYLALDPASYGLEAVGLGFGDTPALIKVSNDEELEKALSLVEAVMLAHGFEKSDEPAPEKPYEGKGFGYRIHFVEE